ncbi:threonine transporter RhtB [Malikia spinosa]|uniref:Threonine transporter RhtB n=1 Tax=Malikia spinosa TaxID=86180 RepID=A0A2S9KE77_9BURK|nr:LysE family translocator [Malikia spinosa]PRD68685.1 threonine transporter RhtB [Malikia spinosa]
MTAEAQLGFFGIALLLGLSPGPDNLFVLMQSATQGRRAGLLVTLGLCTGLLAHTAAVALGLAALLASSPAAFSALKLAGAAYLLYLAWGAWRAPATLQAGDEPLRLQPWRLYGRGVLMNLSNPKVAIFFLALLPQFVQEGAGPVPWQIARLGALFMLATLIVFGSFAWLAGGLSLLLRSARAQQLLNRSAALVFVGLGIRLIS